jgi:ATP-binding cassette subfamily B protein
VTDLRAQLFSSTIEQDISFFDSSRVGDLLSRLGSDTELVQRALTINISVALRYFIQVLGGIALMLIISVKLTVLIVMLIPIVIIGSMFWGKKLRILSKRMQAELGEASVIAEESVTSVRTVRVFAGESHEISRYGKAIQTALKTGLSRTSLAAMFSSSMVFVMHSAIALVVWYGGHLVQSGELSVGDLTGFLLYCVIVAVSFGFLANTWVEFMQAVGASERIFEIVDQKATIISPLSPKPIPKAHEAALTFSDVTFAYPSRPAYDVLKQVSFQISPGETVALVGPSGAGKSTIASLIPRFYDPSGGEICYGGVPLNQLSLTELRNEISIVAQQPQVFSCSIGENIRYGRVEASQIEIESAAQAANIHSFIESLPKGYDTLVGDKGIQLSGGERQRLAIARALLKNPSFLILDEATSALDSENEHLVQQALERLMENRSCLVIAHRLSTVQHADAVHVLKDGSICQTGTHQDLLAQPGIYQRLVQHQLLA